MLRGKASEAGGFQLREMRDSAFRGKSHTRYNLNDTFSSRLHQTFMLLLSLVSSNFSHFMKRIP